MSTNAIIHIIGDDEVYTIYKHWDGYPSGIQKCINKALDMAWELPRFEADEFAAAFVAANKDKAGDIRLVPPNRVGHIWFDFIYSIQHVGEDKLRVTIGHCTGQDELDRFDYVMTWDGYHNRMHEAYAEDAA